MGVFAKGDVVVAPLDFSDFSDYNALRSSLRRLVVLIQCFV